MRTGLASYHAATAGGFVDDSIDSRVHDGLK